MPDYKLSEDADRDIDAIATYTLENWNEAQADRYLIGLHRLLERLAANPRLGISCEDIRAGYFRRRYRSHMIFFRRSARGIFVIRVLHAQMDFLRHL
jgi:toxin ParE1/3/4